MGHLAIACVSGARSTAPPRGARPAGSLLLPAALLLALAGPASAQTTLEARDGDGIWTLLRRAEVTPTSAVIDEFKRANAGDLIRGDQLVAGRAYVIPASALPRVTTVPLFGPRYERVEHRSDRLAGRVYYIVGGHGGPDPGTVGRYRGRALPEDEVAYDVGLRLARRLIEEGATVHVIVQDPDDGIRDGARLEPDSDERYLGGRPIALGHERRLRDRATIINRLYEEHRATARSQRLLALHVDARGQRNEPQIDVHFQVASDGGSAFARTLLATLRAQYERAQPGRGYRGTVERRDLYVLVHTKPVAALVELGNIRHPRDQLRLTRASNRQALAEWLTQGLIEEATATAVARR